MSIPNRSEEKSPENEQYYRELFAHSIDGVLLTRSTGEILYANPAACTLFGYTEAELQAGGRNLVVDLNDPRLSKLLAERQQNGQAHGELTFIRRDGTTFEGEISSAMFTSSHGQTQTSMFIRDITERKKIEAALRKSEKHFKDLFQSFPLASFIWQANDNGDFVLININHTADILTQNKGHMFIGLTASEIYPDRPDILANLAQCFQEKSIFKQESLYTVRSTGDKEYLIFTYVFVEPDMVMLHSENVTDHKKAEAALQKSEEYFRLALHNAPVAVSMQDRDLRYIWAYNQHTVKHDQIIGRFDHELFTTEEAAYLTQLKQRVLTEAIQFEEKVWLDAPNGRRYLQVFYKPIHDETGHVSGVATTTVDLTHEKLAKEALRESKAHYVSLVNSLPQNLYRIDLEGRITFVNQSLMENLERVGIAKAEILGTNSYDMYPPDLAQKYRRDDQQVIASGQSLRLIEENIDLATGKKIFVDVLRIPIFGDDGQVIGIQGVVEDVTNRKQAEKALRESEAQHRRLVQNISAGIIIHAPNTHILLANEQAATIFGLTTDQLMSKMAVDPAWHFVHDDGSYMTKEEYPVNRVLAKQAPIFDYVVGINRLATKDIVWVIVNAFPELKEDGTLRQIVVTFIDITKLKQTEAAVRQSEENLRITLNSIGDAVIATDTNDQIVWMNPVAERLTGWPQAKAVQKPFHQISPLVHAQSREPVPNLIDTVLQAGQIVSLSKDILLIAKDGTEHDITASGAPMLNTHGEAMGVVLVLRDVTQQLRTEQELLKAKKLESLGVLAGGIAHDFNNLLTSLFGHIELAKLELPPTNQAYQYLEEASHSMEKARGLTNQLLTFAKGGAPIKEVQDIGQLLTEVATFTMHGSNAKLNLEVASDLWLVEVDEAQLSRVINNLIINARQAMPKGGSITLSAVNAESDGQPYVKITIQDEGCGISPKNLAKIFDPYFSTKSGNSGLGLAAVHSIVTKHNGQITVSSQLQKGSTFTILLPANPNASLPKPLIAKEAPDSAQTNSARILVLDDDETLRAVLKAVLAHLGHRITLTEDGQSAIAAYQTAMREGDPYQVAILDLTIPGGMNGQEVAQKILNIDLYAQLIVSSGYANDPVMANYKSYGFKGRIQKPYELATLQQTLQTILA